MQWLSQAQNLVVLVLGIAGLVFGLWAFVDAAMNDKGAYAAEGKQSKTFWLVALGISLAVLFVSVTAILNMFGLIALVAVGVYFADVRPALKPYRARKRKGGASGSGPHGSW
ncbi:DUF2516 family protein [Mobilicoccus caccae]|uniref:Membrane protein n=1 Tax=Mobilicoccus caccae TaxID=1859295 RepID=A0ABQ6ITJ0_9MICO|nr:DUF2516 family protein [Mobilicoccus caccae]GMA40991.1 membrane protein [Mobilicoccus caccae]